MEILGRASTYDELKDVLVARRRELGMSQLAVDFRSGLPDGYCGKIEIGTKRLGSLSLPLMLGALGVELVVVRKAA